MAAAEIVMDRNTVLGPVDPQIGEVAASSILKVVELKKETASNDTLIKGDPETPKLVSQSDNQEQVQDTLRRSFRTIRGEQRFLFRHSLCSKTARLCRICSVA